MNENKCKWHLCSQTLNGRKIKYCSKKCSRKANVARKRKKDKIKAVSYKGGSCEKCGYNTFVEALTFHHPDNNKEFGISQIGFSMSWTRLKTELDKCKLLCNRCHIEEHVETHLIKVKNTTCTEIKIPLTKNINKICRGCKKDFLIRENSYANYCSETCRTEIKREIINNKKEISKLLILDYIPETAHHPRIQKQELITLIDSLPMMHIAKKYNVSDKSVKNGV